MAGISSTVRLNDGMSSVLKNMNKALNMVINSFETMQSISGNSIDVSNINETRALLSRIDVELDEVSDGFREAGQSADRMNREVAEGSNLVGNLTQKVIGLVGAYATFQSASALVNLSDSLTQTESRLALVAEQSGDSVEELQERIMNSANASRAAYLETSNAVTSFAQRAGDAFKDANDKLDMSQVIGFTETLNKMYVIAGATAEEQSSSMLQLTQALGSGVLRGEEFNAVFEAAPNIMQAVADYMGQPIGALREMAAEGMITADIVKNAIFAASEDVNKDFQNMNMTWAQVMTLFKNNAILSLQPVLDKINELANNESVQNFMLGLGHSISFIATMALEAFELLAGIGSFMYDNWSLIAPILAAITTAMILYNGALLVSNTIQAISNGLKTIAAIRAVAHGTATAAEAAATTGLTAAQIGFNAALYSCPLTWILLLIIGVIAAIYLVVAAINKVTGSTISATGVIAGAVNWLVSFLWNLFVGLVEIVLTIVNAILNEFISFANFFANLFNDPIAAIIHKFGDMADGILGILQGIAAAIDAVFGSNLADSVSGWRGSLDAKIETAANKYGNGSYEEVASKINTSASDLGLERKDLTNSYNSGYEWGAGVESKVTDSFKNIFKGGSMEELMNNGAGLGNYATMPYEDLIANTGDTADNTGSMKDAMEISEEELKYLRDLAEQEAVNRFTTAEIRVDMGGITNNVSSNTDLDGVVSYLEDRIYETMTVAAEGVY